MRQKHEGLGATPRSFLGKLGRDRAGNTLALFTMALIPLCALAGSAIDASRLYFIKVRLQQSCDAGALAGRKFMTDTNFTTDAQNQANSFFDNNFKLGAFGTTSRTRDFTKTVDNQVHGAVTAVVPMTLMKMFGMQDVVLAVGCEAKLEIPNLDVMFVLDTTGSMGETNPGDTVTRISALRTAVGNFYDTLELAKSGSSQIRYGFLPYSSTVNVGLLLRREWVVDNWTYQSRTAADITTTTNTSTQGQYINSNAAWVVQSGTRAPFTTYGNPESCAAPANTRTITSSQTAWVTQPNGSQTRTATERHHGSTYAASLSNGVCTITEDRYTDWVRTRLETRTVNPNAGQKTTTTSNVYWWNYQPVQYDLTALKGTAANGLMAGGTFQAPQLSGGNGSIWSPRTITWNSTSACIEERDTVRQSDYTTIPTAAYDLDIDMIPQAGVPGTQWRPWLSQVVYARSYTGYTNPTTSTGSWPTNLITPVRTTSNYINLSSFPNDYAACPTAARKLGSITKADLTTYLNSLVVRGRTYHDIGFLWGLRLLSPTGLFASENTTAPNGSAIARHIIFMTDGQTETNFADYDAYGLAAIDRRRTDVSRLPTGNTEQNTIVENRLTALCRAAQGRNVTVWVIAFGTTLSPLLSSCATPGGRSFQANNAAELNTAFANIAANIAKLRLSQ